MLQAYNLSQDAWALQASSRIPQAPLRQHTSSNALVNDRADRSRLPGRLQTFRLSKLFTKYNRLTLPCLIPTVQALHECGRQHIVRYSSQENDNINRMVNVIPKFCHLLCHKPPQELGDPG